jgi:uncharacterized protein YkwD
MMAAAMAMQSADAAPTASEVLACDSARVQSRAVMGRWTTLKTSGLGALNAKRKAAGLSPIAISLRVLPLIPAQREGGGEADEP